MQNVTIECFYDGDDIVKNRLTIRLKYGNLTWIFKMSFVYDLALRQRLLYYKIKKRLKIKSL